MASARTGRATDRDVEPGETAERVLRAASRLFYERGVRAVGVEAVVEASGVAKTSLYRHFETKDDLVAAWLLREDEEFWEKWAAVVRPVAGDPARELMALLAWIGRRVSREGYRGCPQINVAAEFSDPDHPARRIRARHKAAMHARLEELARRVGVPRPEDVAHQLALLVDGAFTSDGRLARAGSVRLLQSAARALLDGARTPRRAHGARSRARPG